MKKNIEELIEGVLHEMKIHGLTQSTINQYRLRIYRPVIKFFNTFDSGNYTSETLESCIKKYENSYSLGKIQKHHYKSMIRSLGYIRDYYLCEKVNFARKVDTRLYKPSAHALNIIEGALRETNLKEQFKSKIHVSMRNFFCFIESNNNQLVDITNDIVRNFIIHASKTNSASMAYIVYSLKVLFSYLRINKIIDITMDLNYFVPKSLQKKLISAFTINEIGEILKCIDCSTSIGKRDNAIILLACRTGFRGIDIIHLKLEDIHWQTGEISIIQSKTGKAVRVPINGQVMNAVADYILYARAETKCKNIFIRTIAPYTNLKGTAALDKILDNLCIKASIEKKNLRSFHSLRRSFATWLSEDEVPIATISQMLGHKNIDSAKAYLSFNRNQLSVCVMGFEDIPLTGGIYL
ncbi:MAG: tyrosine-type recombinase/integrase [Clostridium sp.]